jgi:hypothetical protein
VTHCALCFQSHSVFKNTVVTRGVSWENVHKLLEIVDEFMLNDACYINIFAILDGYRLTKLWGLEFQEVKVSSFVAITSVCVSVC